MANSLDSDEVANKIHSNCCSLPSSIVVTLLHLHMNCQFHNIFLTAYSNFIFFCIHFSAHRGPATKATSHMEQFLEDNCNFTHYSIHTNVVAPLNLYVETSKKYYCSSSLKPFL